MPPPAARRCRNSLRDLPEPLLVRVAIAAGAPSNARLAELFSGTAEVFRRAAGEQSCRVDIRSVHFNWRRDQQSLQSRRLEANRHVAALGRDGTLYTFGWNHAGQLGTGDLMERLSPFKVPASGSGDRDPVAVAVAMEHSVCVDAAGAVWGWGIADGRFGCCEETHVDHDVGPHFTSVLKPCRVTALQHVHVCSVACSSYFTLFLSAAGEVYQSIGLRCGHQCQPEDSVASPLRKVPRISHVVQVSAGGAHALALTDTGGVFSWGSNDCGQCGEQPTESLEQPCRVALPGKSGLDVNGVPSIVAVSAGGSHSLAITREACLLTWGRGCWGQLGHGDYTSCPHPRIVDDLCAVRRVAGGNLTSLLLTSGGFVFGMGRNYEGQLGRGETQSHNRPTSIPVELVAPNARVIDVCAGRGCSYFILADGGVLACGCGYNGRLGIGSRDNVYKPKKISGLFVQ